MPEKKPSAFLSLLMNKCPSCRREHVFVHKSIFPLRDLVRLKQHCGTCGQKLIHEQNNGGGINYALSMILFFLNLCWYWPVVGLSYKDNSVYHFLITSTLIVLVLQPWLMRLSRMIYLYLYVRYGNSELPKE